MKAKYTLIIISGITFFCYACTKNGSTIAKQSKTLDTAFTTTPITASIIGKWYVNKQRVQVLTASTGTITDTTYSGNTFNTDFYYQFNSDSIATFTQGTTFFTCTAIVINGSNQTITRLLFKYNVTGSTLTVAYKFHISMSSNSNPGPYPLTIVRLDANTLILHGITSTMNGSLKTVLDIYLTHAQ